MKTFCYHVSNVFFHITLFCLGLLCLCLMLNDGQNAAHCNILVNIAGGVGLYLILVIRVILGRLGLMTKF